MFIRHRGLDHHIPGKSIIDLNTKTKTIEESVIYTTCGKSIRNSDKKVTLYKHPRPNKICPECSKEIALVWDTVKEDLDKFENLSNSVSNVIRNMIANIKRRNGDRVNELGSRDRYDFIPYNISSIVTIFGYLNRGNIETINGNKVNLKRRPNIKFLDVGCGIGNIMLLAMTKLENIICNFHGIEYDRFYADICRTLTGADIDPYSLVKVFNRDALDFEHYGDYDIIYFYCPFINPKLQHKLEKKIESQMKVGCIYIPMLKRNMSIRNSEEFEMLKTSHLFTSEPMYVKVK
jgi:hypothetical protein